MNGPDVWWDGVTHKQIIDWTNASPGTGGMDALAERLTKLAETLNAIADVKNTIIQRINSGEWSGGAAEVAAQAMQVMRDFDDTMGHRSQMNTLAIDGQSDNAAWVRASVPPLVDTPAVPAPTGHPIDVLNSTVDHQRQLQAAREAEEQARQVMREYEAMTVDRIAALPPLAPAPQVVITGEPDTIAVGPGSPDQAHGGGPAGGDDTAAAPQPENPVPGSPTPGAGSAPAGRGLGGGTPAGTDPSRTEPSGTTGGQPLTSSPVGMVTETPRTAGSPAGGIFGGEGQPHGGRPGGERGRSGLRGGTTEMVGRGGARGGPPGVTPVGAASRGRSDEDKDHQVKFGLAGARIFEPDNDNGLLHDPFRPGSFVAPASIGDDDDE